MRAFLFLLPVIAGNSRLRRSAVRLRRFYSLNRRAGTITQLRSYPQEIRGRADLFANSVRTDAAVFGSTHVAVVAKHAEARRKAISPQPHVETAAEALAATSLSADRVNVIDRQESGPCLTATGADVTAVGREYFVLDHTVAVYDALLVPVVFGGVAICL